MADVFGVHLDDLPEGCTPLEAIVIVKALDEDGAVCLYPRQSEALSHWEAIGMLRAHGQRLERELDEGYVHGEEDDESDG